MDDRGEDDGGGERCSVAGARMEQASSSFSQWKTTRSRSVGDETERRGVSCSRSSTRDGDKAACDIGEDEAERSKLRHIREPYRSAVAAIARERASGAGQQPDRMGPKVTRRTIESRVQAIEMRQ